MCQKELQNLYRHIIAGMTHIHNYHYIYYNNIVLIASNTLFSVKPIQTQLVIINGSSCIKITISSMCIECAYSFQAKVTYRNGSCDDTNELVTTEPIQFNSDYTVYVPIEQVLQNSACYNASIYHESGVPVEIISQSNINLHSCNMTSISYGGTVNVLHNANWMYNCSSENSHDGGVTVETRCVNGTFMPLVVNCSNTSVMRLNNGKINDWHIIFFSTIMCMHSSYEIH